jgi:hypothetical protein
LGFESLPRSLRNPLQTAGFALVLRHPAAAATPSPCDIESAIRYGWSLFAIHGVDGLRLWAPDRSGGCREVAFEIVS